jgi:tetratricopeptide (TPR) repeat protein
VKPTPLAIRAVLGIVAALLVLPAAAVSARGAAEDVADGNAAFRHGDPKKALSLYDAARRRAPQESVPLLDYGIALYEQGDYAGALAAFQDIRASVGDLASEIHYDQGNALAMLGRAAEKDTPDAALDFYARSVAAFQRALAIDRSRSAAAINIEVVREWMKSLRDAQKQQSGSAQQQGQQQSNGPAQGAPNQGAPNQNGQQQSGQAPAPPQNPQAPQAPSATPDAGPTPATPRNDTAESIIQEERDRLQAEASATGVNNNESPNW